MVSPENTNSPDTPPSPPPPPPATKYSHDRLVKTLVTRMCQTFSQSNLYSIDHPATARSIENMYEIFRTLFELKDYMEISVEAGKLFIEGIEFKEKSPLLIKFIRHISSLPSNSFLFSKGLTAEELKNFMEVIIIRREETISEEEFSKMLLDRDVTSVIVKKVHYARITDDEKVVGKDEMTVAGTGYKDILDDDVLKQYFEKGAIPEGVRTTELLADIINNPFRIARLLIDYATVEGLTANDQTGNTQLYLVSKTVELIGSGVVEEAIKGMREDDTLFPQVMVRLGTGICDNLATTGWVKNVEEVGNKISEIVTYHSDSLKINILNTAVRKGGRRLEDLGELITHVISNEDEWSRLGSYIQECLKPFGLSDEEFGAFMSDVVKGKYIKDAALTLTGADREGERQGVWGVREVIEDVLTGEELTDGSYKILNEGLKRNPGDMVECILEESRKMGEDMELSEAVKLSLSSVLSPFCEKASRLKSKKGKTEAVRHLNNLKKSFRKVLHSEKTEVGDIDKLEDVIEKTMKEYTGLINADILATDYVKKLKEIEKAEKRFNKLLKEIESKKEIDRLLQRMKVEKPAVSGTEKTGGKKAGTGEKSLGEIHERFEQASSELENINNLLSRIEDTMTTNIETQETLAPTGNSGRVTVDARGTVLFLDGTASALLNVSLKDKIGTFVISEDLTDAFSIVIKKHTIDKEVEIDKKYLKDSVTVTDAELNAGVVLIQSEHGEIVGKIAPAPEAAKPRKERAPRASKMDFMAHIVHELRSPLVAIKQAIGLIMDGTLGGISDDIKKFLGVVVKNIERLSRLINDILDYSKISAGRMELSLKAVSIVEIVNDVALSMGTWANNKKITLAKQIPAEEVKANIDPDKIIQVLTNLVSNAIKFTPENGTITLGVDFHCDQDGFIRVSVSDTGIGIPKQDLRKVFEAYQQAKSKHKADVKGTGLGLPISKKMVELHKGTMWVESEEGKGSTFRFTLPKV